MAKALSVFNSMLILWKPKSVIKICDKWGATFQSMVGFMKFVVLLSARCEAFFKKQEDAIKMASFSGFVFAALQVLLLTTVVPENFLNLHYKIVLTGIALTAFGPLFYGLIVMELRYLLRLFSQMVSRYPEYVESGISKYSALMFVSHGLILH